MNSNKIKCFESKLGGFEIKAFIKKIMEKYMSKIIRTFILMTFTILVVSNILAQEKLSQEKVTNLHSKAWEMLKDTSYRVKTTSEHYNNINDSKPYLYVNSVTEITSAGTHNINERKTSEGITRTEKIEVGKRIFTRKNDEDWKELTPENDEMESLPAPKSIDTEKTVEVRYLGKEDINKQKADLYEIKTTRIYKIRDNDVTSVYINKFWLDQKGRFLKTEGISTGNGKLIYSSISEYEYNPKDLKIEAPIK